MASRDRPPLQPLDYPFEQPLASYLQVGESTQQLPTPVLDLDGRAPLLAYGANASPLALARKLASLRPSPLPMLRARLRDLDAVYSAHVSPHGAVPATLHASPGTTVTVFVAYPDPEQLGALTATEPNYELTRLRRLDLELDDGGRVAELDAYLSRHGPLLVDGTPLALAAIEAFGRRFPQADQRQAQAHADSLPRPF
ncbi:MAG TPA: hypothetical protein VK889_02550 [Solirubrobacterales bacterium]|nr:hypothetical protein [Solirubrobacterales bacterium]